MVQGFFVYVVVGVVDVQVDIVVWCEVMGIVCWYLLVVCGKDDVFVVGYGVVGVGGKVDDGQFELVGVGQIEVEIQGKVCFD